MRNIPPPSRASVEFELMHRHPILYPVIARLDSPAIKVSQLRIRPYHEHENETTAGSSKYVSVLLAPLLFSDRYPRRPHGSGLMYPVDRLERSPAPSQYYRVASLGTYPHARLQVADEGVPVSGFLQGSPRPADHLPPNAVPNSTHPLTRAVFRAAILVSVTRGSITSRYSTGHRFPFQTS